MAITTKFYTWTEIYAQIVSEADLADEDIIDETEMMGYCNEAIDEAETRVNALNEDYFLRRDRSVTLVIGTDEYALPTSIWAQKIRTIMYRNGTTSYEVKRIPTLKKFLEYSASRALSISDPNVALRYFVLNDSADAQKIVFTPVPAEAGQYIEIWHIRQANRMTTGADKMDIPEAMNFVMAYLRERVWFKCAAGSAKHADASKKLDVERENLPVALKEAQPDGDNEIEADIEGFDDHHGY